MNGKYSFTKAERQTYYSLKANELIMCLAISYWFWQIDLGTNSCCFKEVTNLHIILLYMKFLMYVMYDFISAWYEVPLARFCYTL